MAIAAEYTDLVEPRLVHPIGAAHATEQVSDREWIEQRFDALERKLGLLAAADGNPGARLRSGESPDD